MRGLLNVQFAIGAGVLYVLEANPRASRTVPFVSKALGHPARQGGVALMVGRSIRSLVEVGLLPERDGSHVSLDSPISVKEAVLPFKRFRTREGNVVDSVLGPEMRSTGEVMGIDVDFPRAFAKSQDAAYGGLPDLGHGLRVGRRPRQAGDRAADPAAVAARIRHRRDRGHGRGARPQRHPRRSRVRKYFMGQEVVPGDPSIVELINAGKIDVVINTPSGRSARADGFEIRTATVAADKPLFTTIAQLGAAVASFEVARGEVHVRSLQDYALDRAGRLVQSG